MFCLEKIYLKLFYADNQFFTFANYFIQKQKIKLILSSITNKKKNYKKILKKNIKKKY